MSEEERLQYHEFIAEALVCDALEISHTLLEKRYASPNVTSLPRYNLSRHLPGTPLYRDLTSKIAEAVDASLYEGRIAITFNQISPIGKLKLAHEIYILLHQHGLHCEEKYIFRRLNVLDNKLSKPSRS